MVGGMKRRTPPRELARDPETWPEADLADTGAAAVQHIARNLTAAMSGSTSACEASPRLPG